MDSLSAANGTFAINFLKKINESNKTGNIFVSPLSISSALSMVLLGAKGNTATQMSQVLKLDKVDDAHCNFQSLISEINKSGTNYLLRTANRLYGEKSYTFLEEFLGSTQKHYHADLKAVDFSRKAEESRGEINEWVAQKTEGKIKDLLSSGSVDSLTRLVLVNAIYFKGNWANKFNPDHTHESPFRLNKNETKPVQMMFKKAKFPMTYIGELFTKVVEIPYVDNELSMIILLPDDINDGTTGLEALEQSLTHEKFLEWTNPEIMHKSEIELSLPKFKLEDEYDLKSVLSSMGMPDAFDLDKSDLSGMSGNMDLCLSKVMHKSFVEVNEEGTEAAAASAGIAMMCLMREEEFNANHPFLFFIRHNATKSILFFGRYSSP
uniref:Serpin B6 n=1 Tax=Xenopus tropicalis TaxID=8364 RepID=A0A803JPP1_XENTR